MIDWCSMKEVQEKGVKVEAAENGINNTNNGADRQPCFSERVAALLRLQPLNPLERPVFKVLPRNAQ